MKWMIASVAALLLLISGMLPASAMAAPLGTQPPAFAVTAGEIALPSMIGLNVWDGAMVKRGDTLEDLARENPDIPYVYLGTEIVFTIDGPAPDSMVLRDYLLRADGTEKYWVDDPQNEVAFTFEDGVGRFDLLGSTMTLLSSNSADYEPGNTIWGFKLTCSWGENECEYAFILRTDAGISPQYPVEPVTREEIIQLEGADETIITTRFESTRGYAMWLDMQYLELLPESEGNDIDEFRYMAADDDRYSVSINYSGQWEYTFAMACDDVKQVLIDNHGSAEEIDAEGVFTGFDARGFAAKNGDITILEYVVDAGEGSFYIYITFPHEAAEGFGSRMIWMLRSFELNER